MNKTNNKIEEALSMYKVTVSPPEDILVNILNQIPEKEKEVVLGRVIRSPYIWFSFRKYAPLFIFVIMLLPVFNSYQNQDPFYQIDKDIENFEIGIDNADYQSSLKDYN